MHLGSGQRFRSMCAGERCRPGSYSLATERHRVRRCRKVKETREHSEKIPFGRRGEPENIADTVLFLASSDEYITGQVINVDGGRTLNQ